jgi:hypothetical protein
MLLELYLAQLLRITTVLPWNIFSWQVWEVGMWSENKASKGSFDYSTVFCLLLPVQNSGEPGWIPLKHLLLWAGWLEVFRTT